MEDTLSTVGSIAVDSVDHNETNKQCQLAATLQWVDANYECVEGVCVPRCVLYQHYQDFCWKQRFVSVGPATFGKIIRQRFPKLTTRRLGTRGQSRYHYYGIGIKQSSPYYRPTYAGTGLSRFSRVKVKTDEALSGAHKWQGTLLPLFPQLDDLLITNPHLQSDKVETFLVMYRTHCQRILDAIVGVAFEEVEHLLVHFWQAMPQHMWTVVQEDTMAKLVAVCDVILYKIVNDVLIPSSFQHLPQSLCDQISTFINNFRHWLDKATDCCPLVLKHSKTKVAVWFVRSMQHQLSFIRLAQISGGFVGSAESRRQMVHDLRCVDIEAIGHQLSIAHWSFEQHQRLVTYFESLLELLTRASPLEDIMEWLDQLIHQCLSHDVKSECATTSHFLLRWTHVLSLIIRDLTLHNSTSFGFLHVFQLLLNEYVFVVMETQHVRGEWRRMRTDVVTNCLRPDSSFARALLALDNNTTQGPTTQQ